MADIRFDTIYIPKMYKTEEGFLKGDAIVSRAGVFKYLNLDGTERGELRHPDEVFKEDSLNSLKGVIVTVDHPNSIVSVENAHQLAVGITGDNVRIDGENIIVNLTIHHKDAIEAINKGLKELSLGYKTKLRREDGEYDGEKYHLVQEEIVYNHLAVVETARAGRSARINLDKASFQKDIQMTQEVEDIKEIEEVVTDSNVDLQKEIEDLGDKIEKELTPLILKSDSIKKTSASQVKLDKLESENVKLKKELDTYKQINFDSIISDKVKSRTILLNKISPVVNLDSIDEIVDKSDREIMELVINQSEPNLDLTERSDDYIEGRFDSIIYNIEAVPFTQVVNLDKMENAKPMKFNNALTILKAHCK